MKQTPFSPSMKATLIAIAVLTVVCGPWTVDGTAQTPIRYRIEPAQSKVQWQGYKVFNFGEHTGLIDLKRGELSMANDQLQGSFEIDMNSLRCLDFLDEDDGGKSFNDHLKSDDFFSVAKFPTAVFTITKTEKIKDAAPGQPNYEITGNLTLKGVTNSLKFSAEVQTQGPSLTAKARFKFDRTKWNVRYGSNKFFGNIGDDAISDAIGIELNLKGTSL